MAVQRYGSIALMVLALALATPAYGQLDPTESIGGGAYQDETAKAAKTYRQGVKFQKKAEKATDPAEREALYKQALAKFHESAAQTETFDARLAMGEVYLVLGDKEQALKACTVAKTLKPRNERAKKCFTDAGGVEG
jgi:tetratricopeptide (TPR) repeat protein